MKQITENGISSSTPELIVRILSKDYPLRINEIHRRLKENHQIDISFQGVRKALQILVSSGKLRYSDGEYSVHKEWIKQLKNMRRFAGQQLLHGRTEKQASHDRADRQGIPDLPFQGRSSDRQIRWRTTV